MRSKSAAKEPKGSAKQIPKPNFQIINYNVEFYSSWPAEYNGPMISCTFEKGNEALLRHVVVDALVLRDERILLVKRADDLLEAGKWALVGGFVERDETLEQTVEREVFEETGYRVHDFLLLGMNANPDRPHEDRQNIAFVFVCIALEKEGEADDESTEQKWFDLEKLPPKEEIAFDHYKNIELYKKYRNGEVTIPVMNSK